MRRLWGFESQLPYEDWSLRLPLNSGANMKMIEAEVNPRPLAGDLSRAGCVAQVPTAFSHRWRCLLLQGAAVRGPFKNVETVPLRWEGEGFAPPPRL